MTLVSAAGWATTDGMGIVRRHFCWHGSRFLASFVNWLQSSEIRSPCQQNSTSAGQVTQISRRRTSKQVAEVKTAKAAESRSGRTRAACPTSLARFGSAHTAPLPRPRPAGKPTGPHTAAKGATEPAGSWRRCASLRGRLLLAGAHTGRERSGGNGHRQPMATSTVRSLLRHLL
jgi:hypothetical protein